jgi:hypothetical protein
MPEGTDRLGEGSLQATSDKAMATAENHVAPDLCIIMV